MTIEEKDVKKEKKDEKEPKSERGGLKKALKKYSPLAMKSAVVTLATTAILAAGCMGNDKKTSDDTNTAETTEVVDGSDAENDIPEEILDAVEEDTAEKDVDGRDGPVRLDSIDEDAKPDIEEDTYEDPVEDAAEDTSVDEGSDTVGDAEEEEVTAGTCGPVPASDTVFLRAGESVVVGNVTVEYLGMSGSEGRYRVSCGTVVETVNIPAGGDGRVDLGSGYVADLHANVVGSHGSNVTVHIRASSP
jgi:hypothetical protein